MEVNMDTKIKTTLFYLLELSLIFSLLPLTACSSTAAASVDATATATEVPTEVITENPVEVITEAPTEAVIEVPTDVPADGEQYLNDTYQLAFKIPDGWIVSEYPVGEGVSGYAPSQAVELVNGDYRLLLHIKYTWDPTIMGGGLGAGEMVSDGSAVLLGQLVPRNRLVYEDCTKLVWYGGRFDDLELYMRLEDVSGREWTEADIPDQIISEVEGMLESFVRTGEPLTPPAGQTSTPTPKPTAAPAQDICALPPRLSVNGWAQVTPGLPNAIRSAPGRGPDSVVLGEIAAGMIVRVLDGPICASGYYWWQVDAGLVIGWTAEGEANTYWLTPQTDESSVPVDGWVGTLVSTPEWPQVDDYFQMLDQGGTRYGIHALDPDLRQQLEATRDTGILVQIWGTLYYGRMDAYNTQIEVTRFEIYTPGSGG
jgi:hypothetical protein